MSVLVTGSIAIDSVETPHGKADDVLGGSCVYFALASALYAPTRLVAVVGEDFDRSLFAPLEQRGIDLSGVEFRAGSRTFRWKGRYVGAMNEALTMGVELNVLSEKAPPIPAVFKDSPYVFLANTHPALQREFARQLPSAKLIVCDTMNLWIESEPAELRKTLAIVHGLVLNEGEARLLTGESNLILAAKAALRLGPQFVVVKKGEHGSLLVSGGDLCVLPAFPAERVVDPTGCGDTFAGAMMGYLAAVDRHDRAALRAAIARGTAASSIVLESFSIDASVGADRGEVERRVRVLKESASFD